MFVGEWEGLGMMLHTHIEMPRSADGTITISLGNFTFFNFLFKQKMTNVHV